MRLFDLSFRYKIPLWSSALILLTAAAISLSFGFQAYDDLRNDMLRSSEGLGRTLVKTLYPAMLNDDVWRAYELVNAPYHGKTDGHVAFQAEDIIVFNEKQQVFVASQPERYPLLTEIAQLGGAFPRLAHAIRAARDVTPIILDQPDSPLMLLAIPIMADDVMLGSLVMVHAKSKYWPRFTALIQRAMLITLLVLAVLLPINWYWGQRMAIPLMQLAARLGVIRQRVPDDLEPGLYAYNDELGRLFQAFGVMVKELREKEYLEKQMLQSERMAAIGRLTAGIAHEINNPLGGMLTAIDTLKHHGSPDPLTARTVSLIERGLQQIKETVAALLVEAKLKSRNLAPQDVDDVLTLILPEAQKRSVQPEFHNSLNAQVSLPSTLVRQIMINLLLNAVDAAGDQGHVTMTIKTDGEMLQLSVTNDGKQIPQHHLEYLFEPFNRLSETGHGLGLWATYQIVQQLSGKISAASEDGMTRFDVSLPLGKTLE